MKNGTTRWAVLGLAISVTATAAACGEDRAAAAPNAYCEASLAIETAPEPEIDFESASPEEQAAAARSWAAETLRPLATTLRNEAPKAVTDEVAVGVAAVEELVATGDFETVFAKPEVRKALTDLHAYDLEHCGWQRIDVTAKDFAFDGAPSTLKAGVTSFEFRNEGQENHELVVLRRNDGVTESFTELFALPEDEAMQKAEPLAFAGADPGDDHDYALAELTPGTYALACFLPQGSIGDHDGEGPPTSPWAWSTSSPSPDASALRGNPAQRPREPAPPTDSTEAATNTEVNEPVWSAMIPPSWGPSSWAPPKTKVRDPNAAPKARPWR